MISPLGMGRERVTARAVAPSLLVLLTLGACVAGCGRDEPATDTSGPKSAPAAAREPGREGSPAAVPEYDLPPAGSALVQRTSRGVTALANEAPLEAVLEQVRQLGGFAVELVTDVDLARPVTAKAVDLGVEETLATVLRGVPYSLHYGVDPKTGGPQLLRVTVGEEKGTSRDRPTIHRRAESEVAGNPEREALLAELRQQRKAYEQLLEERERKRREALRQLEDPDPEVRADAARWIDTDTLDGLEAVANVLEAGRDPEVRVAAAEALGESSDDVTALGLLLEALEDPDPNVVMAALESLEFVGDETTVPMLRPLLQHRDPAVRERVIEAIEFLE